MLFLRKERGQSPFDLMRIETQKHFVAIAICLVLKYGDKWREHYLEMGDYWDGPLSDDSIFLYERKTEFLTRDYLSNLLSQMDILGDHPVYNRDFLQGIIDCVTFTETQYYSRFSFFSRWELKEFLESEKRFMIRFQRGKRKNRNRTEFLPILKTPCKGRLDSYLAGALTASDPYVDENGQIFCRMKNKCAENLKKIPVIFKPCGKYILVSPFYIMLFMGEMPEFVFHKWMKIIDENLMKNFISASFDANLHWRYIFGGEKPKHWALPFLRSQTGYLVKHKLTTKHFDQFAEEMKLDFIDSRIVSRCQRWYNKYCHENKIVT